MAASASENASTQTTDATDDSNEASWERFEYLMSKTVQLHEDGAFKHWQRADRANKAWGRRDDEGDEQQIQDERTRYAEEIGSKKVIFRLVNIVDYPGFSETSIELNHHDHGKNFTYPVLKAFFPRDYKRILREAGHTTKDFPNYYSDEFCHPSPETEEEEADFLEDVCRVWIECDDGLSRVGPAGTNLYGLPMHEPILYNTFTTYQMFQHEFKQCMMHVKFQTLINCPPMPLGNSSHYATLFPPCILDFWKQPLVYSHCAAKMLVRVLDHIQPKFFRDHIENNLVDTPACLTRAYIDLYGVLKLCALDKNSMILIELEQ